jgi:Cu/Ag efflux protein CusF
MKHTLRPLVCAAAVLVLTAPVAMAQMPPSTPQAPATPDVAGSPSTSPSSPPSMPVQKAINGPVKAVDPMAKTVTVGWLLGLFGTKLQVNDDTQIAIEGSKASLTDIREGDEVKASYESQGGKNIARSIDVKPAESAKGPATSSGGQGAPYPQSSGTPGSPTPQVQ